MKPDFDDHVSGQELEEQIDDAILFTMMTEEENNKQMHFTPHTSRRKSGTISSFGAFLYMVIHLSQLIYEQFCTINMSTWHDMIIIRTGRRPRRPALTASTRLSMSGTSGTPSRTH